MNIEWKYKIDLKENALSQMEEKYKIRIPDDLRELLKIANAATPSKPKFKLKTEEKLLGAILSFNPNETEADSFDDAMQIDFGKGVIPFGIDPFGNYICYNTANKSIMFYDYEVERLEKITSGLEEFLKLLY